MLPVKCSWRYMKSKHARRATQKRVQRHLKTIGMKATFPIRCLHRHADG